MSPAIRLRKIPEATRNDERFEAKRLVTAVPEPLTNRFYRVNSWFGDIHYKSSTAGSQPQLWRDVSSPGSASAEMHPFGGRRLSAASGPEGFADTLRKRLVRERLLQNSHRSFADAVLFDGVVRVPLFGER